MSWYAVTLLFAAASVFIVYGYTTDHTISPHTILEKHINIDVQPNNMKWEELHSMESDWIQELYDTSKVYAFTFNAANTFYLSMREAFELAFKEKCLEDNLLLTEDQSVNLQVHAFISAQEMTRERFYR
jgi:hypothetical protein